MEQFAFSTYAKALIELRGYVRGLPLEDLDSFLVKMKTLEDTIVDMTQPLSDTIVKDYTKRFYYVLVGSVCYVDGKPHPLLCCLKKDKSVDNIKIE